MKAEDVEPADRLITRKEVERRTSLTGAGIYYMMQRGEFPAGIKIGAGKRGSVRWSLRELEAWIASRPRLV